MTSRGATPDGLVWLGECCEQLAARSDYDARAAVERIDQAIASGDLTLLTDDRALVDRRVWREGCWDKHAATVGGRFIARPLDEDARQAAGDAKLDRRCLYVDAIQWAAWLADRPNDPDGPLVVEIEQIIRREGLSVRAAAGRVAWRAKGGGTLESKTKRLERKYADRRGGAKR